MQNFKNYIEKIVIVIAALFGVLLIAILALMFFQMDGGTIVLINDTNEEIIVEPIVKDRKGDIKKICVEENCAKTVSVGAEGEWFYSEKTLLGFEKDGEKFVCSTKESSTTIINALKFRGSVESYLWSQCEEEN